MDLNFYSELSDGCPQTVDTEFLDTQAYGGYSVENKVSDVETRSNWWGQLWVHWIPNSRFSSPKATIVTSRSAEGDTRSCLLRWARCGHGPKSRCLPSTQLCVFVDSLVSLAALLQTFHTPSLGDEVFELPPISLDPDPTLNISDGVSHFALTDGADGTDAASSSLGLRSNLVVEANDPSFASTYVNSSSRGLEHLGTIGQPGDGALLSSSALVSTSGTPARWLCFMTAVSASMWWLKWTNMMLTPIRQWSLRYKVLVFKGPNLYVD